MSERRPQEQGQEWEKADQENLRVADRIFPAVWDRALAEVLLHARSLSVWFVLLFALAACSPEQETEIPPEPISSIPLNTSVPEPQVPEPISAACVDGARFVEDLTVPDGYQATPGEVLDKRWAVENSGSCDWGAGYRLIRIDDGPIDAPQELALYPARAGESGVWSVQLIAPSQTGDQVASWQAQSPDGAFFGDQVFVLIEVGQ